MSCVHDVASLIGISPRILAYACVCCSFVFALSLRINYLLRHVIHVAVLGYQSFLRATPKVIPFTVYCARDGKFRVLC